MKRAEFEHTIRAAGAVLGVHEVLVIGSQALHASVLGDLPDEASRSVEADIAALEDVDGRMADLIDGAIGEASMFHETFGYYAEGWCRRRRCCRAGGVSDSCASRLRRPPTSSRGVSKCTISGSQRRWPGGQEGRRRTAVRADASAHRRQCSRCEARWPRCAEALRAWRGTVACHRIVP